MYVCAESVLDAPARSRVAQAVRADDCGGMLLDGRDDDWSWDGHDGFGGREDVGMWSGFF